MSLDICIPVQAKTSSALIEKIRQASEKADIVELWLGELPTAEIDWETLFAVKTKSYLVNVKGPGEKGSFAGTAEEKLGIFLEAIKREVEYCDVSSTFPEELIKKIVQIKGSSQLILSAHFFENTPELPELLVEVRKMKALGADIVKIAATATAERDLTTIMKLSQALKGEGQRFITIAMGELGRPLRILTPMMGGEMMFAALSKEEVTAPGQMTVEELKKAWRV